MKRYRAEIIVLVLAISGVGALDSVLHRAVLPATAERFLTCYESMDRTGNTGLWERILFSWMLAAGGRSA